MRKYILLLFILVNSAAIAQVAYEQKVVIDDTFGITSPNETAIADMDNDGIQDIIVAGNSKVGWFKSNGAGNFSNCTVVNDNFGSYYNVVAGDLDGDTDIDVAFSIWGNNIQQFYWCKNLDGLGHFGDPILIISGGTFMYNKMQIIDIDADNDLDVLIATYNYFSIFENTNGTGTLAEHIIAGSHTSASTNILNFAVKNVDADPKPEIVSVINGTLSCSKINPDFTRTLLDAITSSSYADAYEIADIDNDGFQDIVTSYNNGNAKKLQYFKNLTGAGSFGLAQNLVTMPSNVSTNGNGNDEKRAIAIADLDNDNKLDIVQVDSNIADANWYKNMGGGVFQKKQLLVTTNNNSRDVKIFDVNGDGRKDILLLVRGDNKVAWFDNASGTGVFGAENRIGSVMYIPNRVSAGDIDGDGDVDLVSSSSGDNKLAWYQNTNGEFTTQQKVITSDLPVAYNAILGDIDLDGDLDVMAFARNPTNNNLYNIVWYENANGLGNFTQQNVAVSTSENILAIRLTDIDQDGDQDIICASSTNLISLYKNNGNGTFAAQYLFSTFTLNKTLLDMVVADIDNDGDSDVLVGFNGDEVAWYENSDGLGNLSTKHVIVSLMNYPISLCVADLDGDNNKEVIFCNKSQSKIGYFKNNGAGVFSDATLIPITGLLRPAIVSAQDIDNDGDLDLIFNNETGAKVSYILNDGLANFSTPYDVYTTSFSIGTNRNITNIVSADFNADGKLDFAFGETTLDKMTWFKNLGLFQNRIKGTVKLDLDVNGCTNSDPNVPNVLVSTQTGTNTFATFSQPDGTYELIANQGDFTTSIVSPLQYYNANPLSQTSSFTAIGQTDLVDFCLQPTQLIDDLQLKIYPLQEARAGFNTSYKIVVYNNGTNPLTGTVTLTYNNGKFNFISSPEAIQSQTANTIVFAFDNLIPFHTKNIEVKFQVKTIPTVTVGESVVFNVQLSDLPNDVHTYDNQFVLHQTILAAYDPNDIAVVEGSEVLIDNADEYLHYIIRFQNTGNSFASRVKVNNVLDDKLDFNTIQLETTSHASKVEITNGNHIDFIFDAIYLPSSTSNYDASQGFITYKIKPKSNVAVGDLISNSASIYFDTNPAITTNTVQTQFVDVLGINDNFDDTTDVVLYPNPVRNSLYIGTSLKTFEVAIYSQVGQLLYENKNQNTIDLSSYNAGIYLVKIIDDQKHCVSKKIIKL